MRNVFMVIMPPGNLEAMTHYEQTILNRVSLERVARFIPDGLAERLRSIFGNNGLAIWGSRTGTQNQAKFDRMAMGDYIMIVEGSSVRAIGQIAGKIRDDELARDLWKPLKDDNLAPWSLVYFIANAVELDVPFEEVNALFGYNRGYRLRGFSAVSEARLEEFYQQYDDLYSVLVRMHHNETPSPRAVTAEQQIEQDELVELRPQEVDEVLEQDLISDHVRMQFKLARLGIKAGEKVWIPANDQAKLTKAFQFDKFDREFSSGIDLPHSYVENIDVVWKQEFRIAAAYEIENSTSIYSGLLRFSDLMILAPNTIYPMFVVAPKARKNLLRKQLERPTFRNMSLAKKVRFLSYEAIDEVDEFFQMHETGLNVDLITGRSEPVE